MRKLIASIAAPLILLTPQGGPAQGLPAVDRIAERAEAGVEENGELSCWIVSILEGGALINPDRIVARGGAIKVPMPARDHSRIFYIEGLPALKAGLVDGSHCYAVVRPAGAYQYRATDGSLATVKAFQFVRFGKPSDRQPNP